MNICADCGHDLDVHYASLCECGCMCPDAKENGACDECGHSTWGHLDGCDECGCYGFEWSRAQTGPPDPPDPDQLELFGVQP